MLATIFSSTDRKIPKSKHKLTDSEGQEITAIIEKYNASGEWHVHLYDTDAIGIKKRAGKCPARSDGDHRHFGQEAVEENDAIPDRFADSRFGLYAEMMNRSRGDAAPAL
ncbi:hypothetical protein [Brevibacillus reuszeri]|uniref:hypothetical protein n=1 Tax=Brevibacillus reuszeri TaxID=54915 RepID=UPI003D1CC24B